MPSYVPIVMYGQRLLIVENYNDVYMLISSELYLSLHKVSFVYTFQFLR